MLATEIQETKNIGNVSPRDEDNLRTRHEDVEGESKVPTTSEEPSAEDETLNVSHESQRITAAAFNTEPLTSCTQVDEEVGKRYSVEGELSKDQSASKLEVAGILANSPSDRNHDYGPSSVGNDCPETCLSAEPAENIGAKKQGYERNETVPFNNVASDPGRFSALEDIAIETSEEDLSNTSKRSLEKTDEVTVNTDTDCLSFGLAWSRDARRQTKTELVAKDQTEDILSSQENVECTTEGISDCFDLQVRTEISENGPKNAKQLQSQVSLDASQDEVGREQTFGDESSNDLGKVLMFSEGQSMPKSTNDMRNATQKSTANEGNKMLATEIDFETSEELKGKDPDDKSIGNDFSVSDDDASTVILEDLSKRETNYEEECSELLESLSQTESLVQIDQGHYSIRDAFF